MSESETQSADADNGDAEEEEDQFEYYPQVTQHPTTAIEGEIVDLVTGADISSDVEDTGSSFGVVYEDPEVVGGSLWRNRNIPDGFETTSEYNDAIRMALAGENDTSYVRGTEVTDETVEAAQERLAEEGVEIDPEEDDYDDLKVSGTDYKVADTSDRDAEVQEVDDSVLGIDVGGGVFSSEEAEEFDADKIMVWYGGMSGQFVGRGLDFNGMPFARYNTDDDSVYLVKGLFQVPIGWRGDTDVEEYGDVPTTDRSKLATDLGRPPRTARPPVLRDDIDGRAFVAIGRYNGGNMHEVHIGREAEDYDEHIEALRDDDLDDDDYDALDMKYDQSPEETLSAEFDNAAEAFNLYHGEGWQDEHEDADWEAENGDGASFDIDVDNEEVEHPTDNEKSFANGVVEKLTGTGMSPDDEIFPVDDGKADLEGLVEHNEGNFSVDPDVDAIREIVEDGLSDE